MAAQTQSPQLVILSQESPEQEAIYKNGQNKQLHSVIKNVPFTIQLGFVGNHNSSGINFHKCTLEATLMYDSLEDKPVHYVSRRPVEYNCTVDPTGDKVSVECVLNVLSSQHEGAHFRLRFAAASLTLTALSDPIRVVSKPLQLKKVKEQRKAAAAAAAADKQATTATSKKRPLAAVVESTTIQDTLSRIEAQQQAQQNLIANLYQTVMAQLNSPVSSPFPSSTPATPSTPSSGAGVFAQPTPPAKRRRIDESSAATSTGVDTPQATFEAHLRGLVDSFHAIAPSSRTQAVRSAVRSSPAAHVEQLSGLVGALCAEGLGGRSVAVTTRRHHHHHHQQPWSSVGSSPLFSAGADASDCDDYDYSNVESFLSTETSPSCSSPMSPGGGQSSAVGTGGERFSFNTIQDLFFDGASSSSLSSAAKSRAVGEELSDEELYNELFASSGGSLPDAWLDLEPSQGRAGQVESSLGVRGGRGLEYVVDKTREKPHRTTTTTATTRTTSKAPRTVSVNLRFRTRPLRLFPFDHHLYRVTQGQQRRRRRLQACGRDFGFFLFVSLTSLSLSLPYHRWLALHDGSLTSHSSSRGSEDMRCLSLLRSKQGKDVNFDHVSRGSGRRLSRSRSTAAAAAASAPPGTSPARSVFSCAVVPLVHYYRLRFRRRQGLHHSSAVVVCQPWGVFTNAHHHRQLSLAATLRPDTLCIKRIPEPLFTTTRAAVLCFLPG